MSLIAYLLPEPWSLLCGNAIKIDSSKNETIVIDTLYRSLMVPFNTKIFINNVEIPSKKQSSIFTWEGKSYRRILLPIELSQDQDSKWFIELKNDNFNLSFRLSPPQYKDKIEKLKSLIRWQIDNFLELGSLKIEGDLSEEKFGCSTRRSWRVAKKFWLGDVGGNTSHQSSLLIKLARDKLLNKALSHVLKNPNKVLKRERVLQNIAKANEFDAGCLQWYIQQPGNSLREKAGHKQKLLSMSRQDNINLLENRVSKWVCDKLIHLAHAYLRDNKNYCSSDKYLEVRSFEARIKAPITQNFLNEVSSCEHHFKPNFVLMQHVHYRHIWRVYQELRNQQKIEDECWKWQTNLWCETGRQLMGAIMTLVSSKFKISLMGDSSFYLKQEQLDGFWQESPITPGPFRSDLGIIEYIDLRDGDIESYLLDWMLTLGCQQLLRQKRNDDREFLMPIWFWHATGDEVKLDEYRTRCLEALTISLPLLQANSVQTKGILISSEIEKNTPDTTLTINQVAIRWLRLTRNHENNIAILHELAEEIETFFS
ncbi:DUF2357 domain-containing protein [Criblamydia sequanensis]|uniref:DUF2357 domain-containing protein n=1 Tax=Candidatus Criblamydia sequanensis CRIB-18 TaxID=1437425 RepID=A0A090D1J8_9BACT|nr:DUF2357 domain-containing protein [Criblamydia sequanensis]CDR33583.1 hypothetical protein CSEC_0752 [Criblamydia sequanensis CRIB-18]